MDAWHSAGNLMPLDLDGPVDVEFECFEDAWIECGIMQRFDAIARRHCTRLAASDRSRKLTYAELHAWVCAVAQRLDGSVTRDGPVGILLPHNACFPVAALACLATGRAYVPIDLKYPPARIATIIEEAGLAAVLHDGSGESKHLLPAQIPCIDIGTSPGADVSAAMPGTLTETATALMSTPADSLAVILYTSGSTGKPKGICNNQRAILQRVAEATNSCHINADDRILLLSSPGTIAGEREMFAALLNGASLHLTDPQLDGIQHVLRAMREERITLCYAVPSLLRMLLRLPGARQAFAHMRVVRIGGDVTLSSDLALFRDVVPPSCHFFASFSSTETPAVFQWFVPQDWQASGPRVPIGYPRPGIDFMVLDDAGAPVPAGETGELVVRSRFLALGQWQNGQLTPGPFTTDAAAPSRRILRTGDLVRQRSDGLWELFGRKDRQIKIRGVRIDAGEVEAALRSCAGVIDAAVLARRSGEEVVALAAFVAPADGLSDTQRDALPAAARKLLIERVPPYMHPADIHLVAAIPQLPGFKPDMQKLQVLDRQLCEAAEVAKAGRKAAPVGRQTAIAADSADLARVRDAVRNAWSIVLGAQSYEADLAWDETDGDSLKAIEMWFYIENRLGFKLPLDAVEPNTTPSGLVVAIHDYLMHDRHAEAEATHAAPDEPAVPLVFLLPGIQDDDPALVRFRAAFGRQVRFKLIDYPVWRDTAEAGGSFDAIVDAVVAKITAQAGTGPYRLAGYSFGGVVAFAAARRLTAAGHRVDFVGLLDTRRWDLTAPWQRTSFHTFLDEVPNWKTDWLKAGVALLIRLRLFGLVGGIDHLLTRRPNKLALWFRRRATRELRYQAFLQWKPATLTAPVTLYYSTDRWPGEPDDFGWSEVCPQFKAVYIGGDHATVIQPPHLDTLKEVFLADLREPAPSDSSHVRPEATAMPDARAATVNGALLHPFPS